MEWAKTLAGSRILSVILGLGLASLFRKVCSGDRCVVVKGPKLADVAKHTYRIDERCYVYKPVATTCVEKL